MSGLVDGTVADVSDPPTAAFARPFVTTEIVRELPALTGSGVTRLTALVGTFSF